MCRSVVANVTDVTRLFEKSIADVVLIGATPEIFSPTSQKFKIFPVV